jgi:hypothetical protein
MLAAMDELMRMVHICEPICLSSFNGEEVLNYKYAQALMWWLFVAHLTALLRIEALMNDLESLLIRVN